ncbi:n-acetylglutamate synthase [bacterium]|nr:n-acetylglutamate synthase [bacterium]
MSKFDFNRRRFRGIENYDDGDLTGEVLFTYHQDGKFVWGEFSGGRVARGNLVARMREDGVIDMLWQYVNIDANLVGGICLSKPEVLPDGRYRVHESWSITVGGDGMGTSVIEEVNE